jgi:hypothetical protein
MAKGQSRTESNGNGFDVAMDAAALRHDIQVQVSASTVQTGRRHFGSPLGALTQEWQRWMARRGHLHNKVTAAGQRQYINQVSVIGNPSTPSLGCHPGLTALPKPPNDMAIDRDIKRQVRLR